MCLLRCICLLGALLAVAAKAADTADVELHPVQVAPNSYYVQGLSETGSTGNRNFISNAGFVITPAGVVVVDALGSPVLAKALIAAIAKLTPQPIHTLVLTHYHADHIYGLQEFKAVGARIVAHRAGKNYLTSDAAAQRLQTSRQRISPWIDEQTRLIAADLWLDGVHEFSLGGMRFVLTPLGPAHTAEDLAVFVPQTGVLFAGDLMFQQRIPFVGNADSKGWVAALTTIQTLAPSVVVPGHGAWSANAAHDIAFTRNYLLHLRNSLRQAAIEMDDFDATYAATDWSEYEGYPLFRTVNRMNAYNVYLSLQHEAP